MSKARYWVGAGLQDLSSHTMTSTDHSATAWRTFYSDGSGNVAELTNGTANYVLTSGGASAAPSWVAVPAVAHTMTSTTHSAGNWKTFYSNASGAVTELTNGTANYVLTSGGASAAPTWAAVPAVAHTMISTTHTAGNWKTFYSNGSGTVTELTNGAADTFLLSGGASVAPSWSNALGVYRQKIMSGNGYFYPNVVSSYTDDTQTGAWIIHSPIPRASSSMFKIRVHGYAYGLSTVVDFSVVGYAYSGITGSIDGVAGAINNYSIMDNGSDGLKKRVGIDASGNVAVALGDTTTSAYFFRLSVDAWVTRLTTDFTTGWSIDRNVTANFGWKDLRDLTAIAGTWHYGATAPNASATSQVNWNGYLYATKVFNAVYNDYAEYFEKDEILEPGDVIASNPNGKGYIKSRYAYDNLVVGVYSDEFGHCLGGNGDGHDEENFAPVGMAGRLRVKVTGLIKKGDLLVASNIPGVAMASMEYKPGTVIGKALQDHEGDSIDRIQMLICVT